MYVDGQHKCDRCGSTKEVESEPSIWQSFKIDDLCKKCSHKQSLWVKKWFEEREEVDAIRIKREKSLNYIPKLNGEAVEKHT